jgi:hypothetical protein
MKLLLIILAPLNNPAFKLGLTVVETQLNGAVPVGTFD